MTEEPGTVIGPYKLLQQIGEGGMGIVYMAEQQKPVRRRVALKIIKPGMDSKQVIARFEAERQALALMDHPNIARVLDAGCTESGRPYFAMELVQGIPITQYCDDKQLSPQERLELFVEVSAGRMSIAQRIDPAARCQGNRIPPSFIGPRIDQLQRRFGRQRSPKCKRLLGRIRPHQNHRRPVAAPISFCSLPFDGEG
jgi:serine/threonine protein kinase